MKDSPTAGGGRVSFHGTVTDERRGAAGQAVETHGHRLQFASQHGRRALFIDKGKRVVHQK